MDTPLVAMRYLFLSLLSLILLTGCEAQATPLAAVNAPTVVAPEFVDVTQPPPLRYGIADHTLPYISNLEQIRENGLVESMPPNPDLTVYDMAIAYGIYDGWQQAPKNHHIILILNPNLAPIDNLEIQTLLRQALNPQEIANSTGMTGLIITPNETLPTSQIRSTLANLGYPDGFRLTVALNTIPAGNIVLQQLNSANIEVTPLDIESPEEAQIILENNSAHALLLRLTGDDARSTWVEQVGESHLIDLFTLPISYVATETITVSFSADGWPIASR